jgi:ParB family chromosome partitioning protein
MLSLVDEHEITNIEQSNINTVPIDRIVPNRYQPRRDFDESRLQELADSIREKGVIQPVVVTDLGDGRYELVAGERRLRASKLANLHEIPVVIRDFSDADRLEIALIENIQRQDLNPIEEALGYKEIMEKLGIGQEEVARRVGKNRSSVANTLRLLKLPDSVREKVQSGLLSEGHARAILSIADRDAMMTFADYLVENGFSVREAENLSRTWSNAEAPQKDVSRETKKPEDQVLGELQERFIRSLGAKVQIRGTHKKGKIEIHYFSNEELENIYRILTERYGNSANA